MSPEYFSHTLTFIEAGLFLQGLSMRYRAGWEQARLNAFYSAAPHCKNFTFDKMPSFSWENENEDRQTEEEREREIEALRARARERDKKILQKM